jgi:hypothetical protein
VLVLVFAPRGPFEPTLSGNPGQAMSASASPERPGRPGDEAPEQQPSTGENICPECAGSGVKEGEECRNCEGTGKVIEPIGGG